MSWILLITYAVWILGEILLNRLVRSSQNDQPKKDKQSLTLIWAAIAIAISGAVVWSNYVYWPISTDPSIIWIGVGLIWLGMVCRALVIRSLGQFFTVDVTIRQNHQLKTDGAYAFIRHPSYTASLLSFIGFGLSLNHVGALMLIVVVITSAFLYRISVEEKALTAVFGEQYLRYRNRTKALFPFIY